MSCTQRCQTIFEYNTNPTETHTTLKPCGKHFCFHARDRQAYFLSVILTVIFSLHFAARDLAFFHTLLPPIAFYVLLVTWIYFTLLGQSFKQPIFGTEPAFDFMTTFFS